MRIELSRYEAVCLRGMLEGGCGFGGDQGGVHTVVARLTKGIERDIKNDTDRRVVVCTCGCGATLPNNGRNEAGEWIHR